MNYKIIDSFNAIPEILEKMEPKIDRKIFGKESSEPTPSMIPSLNYYGRSSLTRIKNLEISMSDHEEKLQSASEPRSDKASFDLNMLLNGQSNEYTTTLKRIEAMKRNLGARHKFSESLGQDRQCEPGEFPQSVPAKLRNIEQNFIIEEPSEEADVKVEILSVPSGNEEEIARLKKEIAESREQIGEMSREMRDLRKQKIQLDSEIEDLEAQDDGTQTIRELEAQIKEEKEQIAQLISKSDLEINELRSTLSKQKLSPDKDPTIQKAKDEYERDFSDLKRNLDAEFKAKSFPIEEDKEEAFNFSNPKNSSSLSQSSLNSASDPNESSIMEESAVTAKGIHDSKGFFQRNNLNPRNLTYKLERLISHIDDFCRLHQQ